MRHREIFFPKFPSFSFSTDKKWKQQTTLKLHNLFDHFLASLLSKCLTFVFVCVAKCLCHINWSLKLMRLFLIFEDLKWMIFFLMFLFEDLEFRSEAPAEQTSAFAVKPLWNVSAEAMFCAKISFCLAREPGVAQERTERIIKMYFFFTCVWYNFESHKSELPDD